jgi:hypothetical protein
LLRIGRTVEKRERVAEKRAARRWRRVRQHVAAPVSDTHRLALERLVVAKILQRECAAVAADPVADRGSYVASVERSGAIGAETFQRVGEIRVDELLPNLEEPASWRPERGALRSRSQQLLEDPRHICLLRVERDSPARERRGILGELGERDRAPSRGCSADPRRHTIHPA